MDAGDKIISTLLLLTMLAVLVASSSQTSTAISQTFGALAAMVKSIMQPVVSSS